MIDATEPELVTQIQGVSAPLHPASDGSTLWADCDGLCRIDTHTNTIIGSNPVGKLTSIAASHSGDRVYAIGESQPDVIQIFDGETLDRIATVPALPCSSGLAISADGTSVFFLGECITQNGKGGIYRLDGDSLEVTRFTTLASTLHRFILVDPYGRRLHSLDLPDSAFNIRVVQVDPTTGRIRGSFFEVTAPILRLSPDADRLVVFDLYSLRVRDAASYRVIRDLPYVPFVKAATFADSDDSIWAVGRMDRGYSLAEIDLTSGAFVRSFPLAHAPIDVAFARHPAFTPPPATPTATPTLPPEIDCNRNGRVDLDELAAGDSCDCDANRRPDECDPDSDRDGIPDACDRCHGYDDALDSDQDGTPNCLDRCPSDPAKTLRGQCGCFQPETDSDGDGVADCRDNCVATRNPDQANGDGDRFGDACDGCPDDRSKVAPGLCGCNQSDGDSDGDGIANCLDSCPFDPEKTEPGVCGCGVDESGSSDEDGDSVADCHDTCPGADDLADSDGDGLADCLDRCPADSAVPEEGVRLLYFADRQELVLRTFNPETREVRDVLTLDRVPRRLEISADGRFMVALTDTFPNYVLVDLVRRSVVEPVTDPSEGRRQYSASAAVAAPSGSRFYLASSVAGVFELDAGARRTRPIFQQYQTAHPWVLRLTHDGTRLLMVTYGRVYVVDPATGIIRQGFSQTLSDFVVRPGSNEAIATGCNPSSTLCVVDIDSESTLRSTDYFEFEVPGNLSVSADGSVVWMVAYGVFSQEVNAFDSATLEKVGAVRFSNTEEVYALDATGRTAFVPEHFNGNQAFITRYSLDTGATERLGVVSTEISAIALGPDRNGDANCDDLFTAADLVAMARIVAGSTRSPCRRDDFDGNCSVEYGDFDSTVAGTFR